MIGGLDAGRAAAAAGQSGLMALYDNLFSVMDLQSAQVLVTSNDFTEKGFKDNLCATVEDLLSMNVVSGLASPLGHTQRSHQKGSISGRLQALVFAGMSSKLARCMCVSAFRHIVRIMIWTV